MAFGICNLSIVPLRSEASDASEMVTQLLFGEVFEVLETQKKWSFIKLAYDDYEAWIDNKQFTTLDEVTFKKLKLSKSKLTGELSQFVVADNEELTVLPLGASLPFFEANKLQISTKEYTYEGSIYDANTIKENIINTAFLYLNAPYLWGGKTLIIKKGVLPMLVSL